jgi:hypothetical protein
MERRFQGCNCPECKEIPKLDTNGTLSCACKDKRWVKRKGVRGTEEERLMLTGKGFREAEDAGVDVYYLGPGHRILWLYPDGAWYVSDGVSQELTLEAYLASAF